MGREKKGDQDKEKRIGECMARDQYNTPPADLDRPFRHARWANADALVPGIFAVSATDECRWACFFMAVAGSIHRSMIVPGYTSKAEPAAKGRYNLSHSIETQ